MTQTTTRKETMNVIDVVNYFSSPKKGGAFLNKWNILFFMNASANRNVCDVEGNMDTVFIRKSLMVNGDDLIFRELECAVTTQSQWY